jgi:hypothetical protein
LFKKIRDDVKLGSKKMKRAGIFFAIIFVLSTAVYAQSYTITVTFNEYGTWETGVLEFSPLGIRTQCWFEIGRAHV